MNQTVETSGQTQINDTASFVAAFGGSTSEPEATKGEKALARATKAKAVGKPKGAGKPAPRGGLAASLKATRATKPAKAAKAPKAPKASKPSRAADQLAAKAEAKAAGKGKSEPATADSYKHEKLAANILKTLAETPANPKEELGLEDGQYTKSTHIEHLLRNGEAIVGQPLSIVDIVDVLDVKYPKNHRRRVLRRIRKVIASLEKRKVKISFKDVPNKLVP